MQSSLLFGAATKYLLIFYAKKARKQVVVLSVYIPPFDLLFPCLLKFREYLCRNGL